MKLVYVCYFHNSKVISIFGFPREGEVDIVPAIYCLVLRVHWEKKQTDSTKSTVGIFRVRC